MRLLLVRKARRRRALSQLRDFSACSRLAACSFWLRSIWRFLNSCSCFCHFSGESAEGGELGGITLGSTLVALVLVLASSGGGFSEKCVVPFSSTHLYIAWACARPVPSARQDSA